jgi:predicted nucleic acid-binding protein
MTIDAFCKKAVKDYFYKLDIDPNFKIVDSTEGELLKLESIDEILEEYATVLRRTKFNFPESTICATLEAIKKGGLKYDRISSDEQMPDPKDIVFYEVALSKEDSYLVTGNIKHFPKKPFVVTPAEILQIIHEMKSPKPGILSEPVARYGNR